MSTDSAEVVVPGNAIRMNDVNYHSSPDISPKPSATQDTFTVVELVSEIFSKLEVEGGDLNEAPLSPFTLCQASRRQFDQTISNLKSHLLSMGMTSTPEQIAEPADTTVKPVAESVVTAVVTPSPKLPLLVELVGNVTINPATPEDSILPRELVTMTPLDFAQMVYTTMSLIPIEVDIAIEYIRRFITGFTKMLKEEKIAVGVKTPFILIMMSLMVAHKYHQDDPQDNVLWRYRLTGHYLHLNTSRLFEHELEFLETIGFNAFYDYSRSEP